MGARTEGERFAASIDLGGDNFVGTALHGMGGGPTAEPSAVAPMLGVLGDELSDSKGEGLVVMTPPHQKMWRLTVRTTAILRLLRLWRCPRMRWRRALQPFASRVWHSKPRRNVSRKLVLQTLLQALYI